MDIFKSSITFIKIDAESSLDLTSQNIEELDVFVDELFTIFGEIQEERKVLNILQFYSSPLFERISKFANKYKSVHPQINAFVAFFKKFTDGEPFFIIPNFNSNFDQKQKIEFLSHLRSIIDKQPYEKVKSEIDEVFETTLSNYTIGSIGNTKAAIGNKQDRSCRFCFRSEKEGATFKHRAHAISEGLGNKNVILYEECDSCNDEFSMSIEPDLIKYLSLFRTFFGIKGNGGIKQFKGNNFNFNKNEILNLSVVVDEVKENNLINELNLDAGNINPQDVYKSFCKYFISVLPNEYLPYFEETIKWIKGNTRIEKIPPIAECISYDFFTEQPILNYYIRKNENYQLPYAVGEFHFTCLLFVFIVPLSNKDHIDFAEKENYKLFWESDAFKHYRSISGWQFKNFSINEEKPFNIHLKMNPTQNKTD